MLVLTFKSQLGGGSYYGLLKKIGVGTEDTNTLVYILICMKKLGVFHILAPPPRNNTPRIVV